MLYGEIKHSIEQQHFNTYAKLLQQCYIGENNLKKFPAEKGKARSGHKKHGIASHELKPKVSPSKGKQARGARPEQPP